MSRHRRQQKRRAGIASLREMKLREAGYRLSGNAYKRERAVMGIDAADAFFGIFGLKRVEVEA